MLPCKEGMHTTLLLRTITQDPSIIATIKNFGAIFIVYTFFALCYSIAFCALLFTCTSLLLLHFSFSN